MSPFASGLPSSAVMTPITSVPSCVGVMFTTPRCSGRSPKLAGPYLPVFPTTGTSGETGAPYTFWDVITRKAIGWIGASVPGGSTAR